MVDTTCRVIRQTGEGDYRTLELEAAGVAKAARPGQFVHLRVPGLEPSALRRPFSIYGAKDGVLRILYKIVGRGTSALKDLKPGDGLRVMGPLGKPFPFSPRGTTVPVLVAGGYGVAPLCFLAERFPRKGLAVIGGRTAADILGREDFDRLGWPVFIATQDGTLGERGLATAPLDRELDKIAADGRAAELFACGPDGLLKAVGQRAIERGLQGWLSLDKHMVCGVGACLACVQRLRRPDGTEWTGRVCVEGPVFESREIVWP